MVTKEYIHERGDIVWINFDPQSGHEQKGKRPAIVLSPKEYNKDEMLIYYENDYADFEKNMLSLNHC